MLKASELDRFPDETKTIYFGVTFENYPGIVLDSYFYTVNVVVSDPNSKTTLEKELEKLAETA